jgi:hypothetical protein
MWLVINDEGYVVSHDRAKPGEQPEGYEVVEWFGAIEWEVYDTITLPSGEEVPVVRGIDPRPVGYEDHRDKMEELLTAAGDELDWLDATIPDIDTMNSSAVQGVVKRLAQENRQQIRAWRYVINRLLNS